MNTAKGRTGRQSMQGWVLLGVLGVLLALGYWQAPFDIRFVQPTAGERVDPRRPVVVAAVGLGSRIVEVAIKDQSGRSIGGRLVGDRFESSGPFQFGMRYRVSVRASRGWTRQLLTRTLTFETVTVPNLAGAPERLLTADASAVLAFDRPVESLRVEGPLDVDVAAAPDRRSYSLQVRGRPAQGSRYPVQVDWTADGVTLPPLALVLKTPPPLVARLNVRGLERVGLSLPAIVTFNRPLASRALTGLKVETEAGALPGRWQWLGPRRVQFEPPAGWPAFSTIRVTVGSDGLAAVDGGYLEKPVSETFTTGAERRIAVYLDTQKATAFEAGRPVRSFAVSSGKSGTPTVTGHFYIERRFLLKTMTSSAPPGHPGYYKVENVPYAQFFHGGYAFHGAWWHNGFGRPMSHGCINLSTRTHNRRWPQAVDDAKWLWDWAALGVPVTVYAHTPA